MSADSGASVSVSIQGIYDLLLEVRDDVRSLSEGFHNLTDRVADHELRIREVEAHGSAQAQAAQTELIRTRERLHKIEGVQQTHTAAIIENAETIRDVRDAVKGTTSTLTRVSLLLLSVLLTAAATFIVYQLVQSTA